MKKRGSVTVEEIEQQMYNDYIYMSEKERDNFIKDYNETKTKLKEINEVMTDEMYKGVYSSEEECLVIRNPYLKTQDFLRLYLYL